MISTPRVPWCGQVRLDLLLILKEGVQYRLRKLTVLHRVQCNERIRGFHEHSHQRLDTPKSKEIKKLLQLVKLNSPHTTLRTSKLLSKRHPDTIDVRMKCDRTFSWIESTFGLQLTSIHNKKKVIKNIEQHNMEGVKVNRTRLPCVDYRLPCICRRRSTDKVSHR